ncbi:MAG TPA: hypothetical protein VGQ46_07810 [Thermoanaerobaculia bacterium]|jgi:hypothetical protein|nr:hypothetical protein [Thermoanaerobaculia bacterium]
MSDGAEVVIDRGSIVVYRMFDVCERIDLVALEANARTATGTSRLRIQRSGGHALIIKNAPVTIALRDQELRVGETRYASEVQARTWDYGVVSIQFRLPIAAGTTWSALVSAASEVERAAVFDDAARVTLDELLAIIAPAVHGRHTWQGTEDHVIFFLEEVRGMTDPSLLLEQADVAALMLGEATYQLSGRARRAIIESAYQYWTHDLAVLDWNSALVVEPSGVRDVADIVEFALTHLIELRYYDDLLDEKLAALYASVSQSQRKVFRTNYARLSREASALFMDISEFIERVENSLKVIGDFYLATIFRGTVTRLRLHEWEENVTRKLQLLARVSELLTAQATAHRSYLLEWVVIALIAFEIVFALTGVTH